MNPLRTRCAGGFFVRNKGDGRRPKSMKNDEITRLTGTKSKAAGKSGTAGHTENTRTNRMSEKQAGREKQEGKRHKRGGTLGEKDKGTKGTIRIFRTYYGDFCSGKSIILKFIPLHQGFKG